MVRFAIDERSLNLDGVSSSDAYSILKAFLRHISDVGAAGHGICYDDELFQGNLRDGLTFWTLFDKEAGLGLDHDDLELAAATFGAMPKWYELNGQQPSAVDVQIDGGPIETTGTVAWAHAQADRGLSSAACLCASHRRVTGERQVSVAGVTRGVWFLSNSKDVESYFRGILSTWANAPADFEAFKSHAFKELLFVDNCFDGIRNMSKPCRNLAPKIVAHLAAFSDNGKSIFSKSWQVAPAEFGSVGVNISDENGATKSDKKAAAERVRVFEGKKLNFWWHSKLEPDRDRIHICPDDVPSGGRIIVGIFCRHMT